MNTTITAADLAIIIQLAVAPVFLLAGIAGFLGVLSGRLGRIIDRARVLERDLLTISASDEATWLKKELRVIWRRVKIIHWSIALCTTSALLVCVLIVCLFAGRFMAINLAPVVVALFVLGLSLLIVALLLFLNEVRLSTRTLRLGGEFISGAGEAGVIG